ncbi:dickkopf-related protein 3-like [Asterias rubens]|uniref:dickkopf-related protein 3-like n=1 Tax=Asterias rubens TaxID=7604 RepID=UPI001455983C|nr:dickkopf-related protein 3-like [Asterias rubens]
MKIFVTLWLLVMLAAALGSVSRTNHTTIEQGIDQLTQLVDKILGSKTVKDKIAELTQSGSNKRAEIVILSKSDIAGDIPDSDLYNTTTITRRVGDVTVVIKTTITKLGGDEIMVEFESEVKPMPDKTMCKTDSNCTEHQFCHHDVILGFALSYCQACSEDGGKCQIDKHCCGQTLCRWGRCLKDATKGQLGTVCSKAGDCGEEGCCASVEGFEKPVCRPLANEGQRCSTETKAADENAVSSSLSVLEKLLRHRPKSQSHPAEFPHECSCTAGLKCANYMRDFDDMLDLREVAQTFLGGMCVPGWAWEDQLVLASSPSSNPTPKK